MTGPLSSLEEGLLLQRAPFRFLGEGDRSGGSLPPPPGFNIEINRSLRGEIRMCHGEKSKQDRGYNGSAEH